MRTLHCLSFALLVSVCPAQDSRTKQAQALADKFVSENSVVGASIAVVRDGKLELAIGAGFADRETKKPVLPTTLIRLGSISKPVTAVGVMKLVEAGKLSLTDTLESRVPEWPKGRPTVTLAQLLSHTGGVRHYKPLGGDTTGQSYTHSTTAEAVKLFAGDPLLFDPGTKESYSTHAYTLIARMIETAGKTDFVSFMRKSVFRNELDCEILSETKPSRSQLYTALSDSIRLETKREDNSWKYGGGGMEATARGLALWADNLRAGKTLSQKSMDQMWTPAKLNDGKVLQYGLGWRIDGQVVSHSGAQQGCRTSMTIDRERKLTVVVLTNTSGRHAPGQLGTSIAALWR